MADIELQLVSIDKPADLNVILGQAHFIKTVEDLHEAFAGTAAALRFGIAFCESSGPRLVRRTENDPELIELATRNALAVGAGHSFIAFLRGGFPVSVLNRIKHVPEVCGIYCATANPVQVVVAETVLGRGILGVVDGGSPLGVESDEDVAASDCSARSATSSDVLTGLWRTRGSAEPLAGPCLCEAVEAASPAAHAGTSQRRLRDFHGCERCRLSRPCL